MFTENGIKSNYEEAVGYLKERTNIGKAYCIMNLITHTQDVYTFSRDGFILSALIAWADAESLNIEAEIKTTLAPYMS